MKYMKLGDLPDTFYTEAATRTVSSDVSADLTIQINNITYKLHKFPLILKCGLLQRLCSNSDDESMDTNPITLNDVPGGEEAFELCAKFCYGISIKLSAHNFVPAICAARFLRMTESVAKGNLVMKLESFFDSCILQGWSDSIVVLQETRIFSSWADSTVVGVVNRCIDTVLRKILTPTSKVTWSYTYTRPGFDKKQQQQKQIPKDWWTEDVADLDLDHFRSIISSLRSTKQLPPQLIGEALHVYTCKQLLDPSDLNPGKFTEEESVLRQRRILESIVSMIPIEHNSVSGRFLLRLLKVANLVDASPSTKAELVRRAGQRLHEVTAKDLLFPSSPRDPESYDVGMVEAVLEIFMIQFRRPVPEEDVERMLSSMIHVARTIDSYLQIIVSQKPNVPVPKIVELVKCLPEMSRPDHDQLYKAIDIYLKNHPDLSKSEKKQLCQLLDTHKLSPGMRSHAIRNDQLPLRTIVQLLFIEQEKVQHISSTLDVKKPIVVEEEEEQSVVEFVTKKSNKVMMMKKEQGVDLKKGEGSTSNETNGR